MFSKQRHSREVAQPIDSGALAAASAIGKAITNNGRTVDHSKIPSYNKVPNEIQRASSMRNSRRNSLQRGPPTSRNNSLNSSNFRRSSLKASDGTRTQSIDSKKKTPNRNNSITRGKRDSNGDVQRTFREFGGVQASGVIHQSSEAPKTVKRYIPSANGLIAIDVPVPDKTRSQPQSSSLRRSASTNGLAISRSGSLTRNKNQKSSNRQSQRRHSSLTENPSISSTRLHSATAKVTNSKETHPLIESYVQEETEQELKQEYIVRPMELSSNNKPQQKNNDPLSNRNTRTAEKKKTSEGQKTGMNIEENLEDSNIETNDIGFSENECTLPVKHEDLVEKEDQSVIPIGNKDVGARNIVREDELSDSNVNEEDASENNTEIIMLEKKISEGAVEQTDENNEVDINSPLVVVNDGVYQASLQETAQPATQNLEADSLKELKHASTADTEYFDSENNTEHLLNNDEIISAEHGNPSFSTQASHGTSLAQHLRAANPYLNQTDSIQNEASTMDNLKVSDRNLYKVPSPMKSALKKSSTRSSNTSSVYSEYSPANDAYISLTTAENTRLNAQLMKAEKPPQKPRYPARPQSMVNSVTNRSSSPAPKEVKQNRRGSVGQPQKGGRNSMYRSSNGSNASVAMSAAKVSTNATKPKAPSNTVTKATQNTDNEQLSKKKVLADKRTSVLNNSALYPKEPLPKKSSFEKLRNNDSTHLGFKKLSLRDESMTDPSYDQGYRYSATGHELPTTPSKQSESLRGYEASRNFLQNSGWKSRIHDSDSDDDAVLFSSAGTSRSTQATSNGNQNENANANSGFSLFKNKSKAQKQNTESIMELAPPQAQFMESNPRKEKSGTGSNNSTPSKINKKWSRMSLRSSSTGDMQEQTSLETPKSQSKQKRFHSHASVDENEKFRSKTLRESIIDNRMEVETPKKKNALGKKLKKLFGRKS